MFAEALNFFIMQPSTARTTFAKVAKTDAEQARDLAPAHPSGGFDAPGLSSTSGWQRERALTLHRVCQRIQVRVEKGQSLNKACRFFSNRWNGKCFRSAPMRSYALNVSSVYRHFRRWRLGGEVPSALLLRFRPATRRIPAPVLVRFIELCAKLEFASFRAAWETFCRRRGNAGPGRVNGRKLKLGFHALYWNCPKGSFAEFKRCWKIIRQAQLQIQVLRIKYTTEIRASVPDRLPRRRSKKELTFEI
jgi:hypothetical protein